MCVACWCKQTGPLTETPRAEGISVLEHLFRALT